MKAVRFHQTGAAEVLQYEEVADLVAAPGQILVRVEAAGVNYADVMRRRGDNYPEPTPLPFTLGYEAAGTVAALGEGVTGPAIGSPVFVAGPSGGYAEYVLAQPDQVIPLPPGLDFTAIVPLFVQGLTAALALKQAAKIKQGDTVLVQAAAGGVGQLAVQLAKLYGASKVIAAASTAEKRAMALQLGADVAVDYTQPDWVEQVRNHTAGQGVDIMLEMVGGEVFPAALHAMAPSGRMVIFGGASNKASLLPSTDVIVFNQLQLLGFSLGTYFSQPEVLSQTLTELIGYSVQGQLKAQIGVVLPLSEAAQAHRLLEGRESTGKVILKPWL